MDRWGAGIGDDPAQTGIVDKLAPRQGDIQLTKWRYSAFIRTDLIEVLAALGRNQLIVCGVYAHIGIQATAADSFQHDIQAFVALDAIADFSSDDHRQALITIADLYGVTLSTDQIIAMMPLPQSTLVDAPWLAPAAGIGDRDEGR